MVRTDHPRAIVGVCSFRVLVAIKLGSTKKPHQAATETGMAYFCATQYTFNSQDVIASFEFDHNVPEGSGVVAAKDLPQGQQFIR